ncbi:MAG: hypothetical protein AABX51_08865 [Nanoarchaeota archaeon]
MPKPSIDIQAEISHLLSFAKSKAKAHPDIARDAVKVASKLAQKFRQRLSPSQKKSFCTRCFSYFIPGHSCTVRVGKSRVAYHCLNCKFVTRFPYIREQKAKRKQ